MVIQDGYCENCGEKYINIITKWCRSCQTTGDEKIDYLIQQNQLEIDVDEDLLFEWIPYNKLNSIKKIGKDGSDIIYSAIWKDGPLYYKLNKYEWERTSDKKITLKYSNSSQNNIDEFLNEVRKFL